LNAICVRRDRGNAQEALPIIYDVFSAFIEQQRPGARATATVSPVGSAFMCAARPQVDPQSKGLSSYTQWLGP
jgi:hypothetical protein